MEQFKAGRLLAKAQRPCPRLNCNLLEDIEYSNGTLAASMVCEGWRMGSIVTGRVTHMCSFTALHVYMHMRMHVHVHVHVHAEHYVGRPGMGHGHGSGPESERSPGELPRPASEL